MSKMKVRTGCLYKRGGVYYVQWKVAGKAYKKSTGVRNHKDALTAQQRIMAPIVAGDDKALYQNLKSAIEGREAEIARIEDKRNPPLTVTNAWNAYELAGNRREIADGTMQNYDSYWTAFTKWLKENHPEIEQLRQVSFGICEEYRDHLIQSKITGRTVNAHRAFFRAFFNVLSDKARLTDNPWAKIAKRDEHSEGRRPLTVEELLKVCRKAQGELRIILAFGLYAGCRLGDAVCMDWGNIDLARRRIRYIPRKTARKVGEALLIPLHPELYGMLAGIPSKKRKGAICPELAEKYKTRGPNIVSRIIQKHFENCDIETTAKRGNIGKKSKVLVGFHSLRHTAVSLMRDAGTAQSVSQAIVGHASGEVHQLYTHTDESSMRRAVATLPAVITEQQEQAEKPKTVEAEKVQALAEKLTAENWKEIKSELLKSVGVTDEGETKQKKD